MNRYFLAISAILLSSLSALLFGVSPVGAASEFDNLVRVTPSLVVRNAYEDDIDMSKKWRTETAELLELRCSQSHQDQCDLLESFQANVSGLNGSHWGVRTIDSGDSIIGGFQVFWTENSVSDQCDFFSGSDVRLECTGSSFRVVNVYGHLYNSPGDMSTNGFYINTDAIPPMTTFTAYGSWYSDKVYLFIWYFNVNYPDGYDGITIPQTLDEATASRTDPLIDWRLGADLLFSARFVGMYNDYPVEDVGQFRWRIYAADDDYNILGDPLDDSYIGFREMYTHQFDVQGHYVARFTVENKIPSVVDFDKVTRDLYIQLDVNGLLQVGGTNKCDDGVCKALPVSCKIQQDFLSRLTCSTQQLFSFGVVGPSIVQLKRLMVSMTVNSDPQCYIPLANVSLAGKTFPLSQYSSVACQKARDFRNNFQFMSIALNFALAVLLIHLIIKMINNLTDDRQNDVIVGP